MTRDFGTRDSVKAESAEAALARCNVRDPFDAFICDFNMKPMNGIQLLQSIRTGQQPHIPRDQAFMLVTGHGDVDVVKAAKALDVSSYAVKPIASETFVKAITRTLAHKLVLRPSSDYAEVVTTHLVKFQ